METKININYNLFLGLIRQLPIKDIEKLAITLHSEITSKNIPNEIQELLLKAPTWSDSDYNDYKKARNFIN
mgnify:CR=1 FL=1